MVNNTKYGPTIRYKSHYQKNEKIKIQAVEVKYRDKKQKYGKIAKLKIYKQLDR